MVSGSAVVLSGQPGIGKSTLLLQLANNIAKQDMSVHYFSAEESDHQIRDRAKRLKANSANLELGITTSADDIAETILQKSPNVAIVDSIQTVNSTLASSASGTPSQLNASTQVLINAAKSTDTALILVGHVTKEGNIAGPKLLEHIVDVVFHLEGDRYGGLKTLRCIKNRHGSTNSAALFEMTSNGLQPILNPSEALLSERQPGDGSVVLATIDGNLPLLIEVQALVSASQFGYPKRTASGFDLNRLNLLIAVLSTRTKLNLADKDIYVNIVGGLKLSDPGADLAVCMAIASAAKGRSLKEDAAVFGELGLAEKFEK